LDHPGLANSHKYRAAVKTVLPTGADYRFKIQGLAVTPEELRLTMIGMAAVVNCSLRDAMVKCLVLMGREWPCPSSDFTHEHR
jgi:hypothetical protein